MNEEALLVVDAQVTDVPVVVVQVELLAHQHSHLLVAARARNRKPLGLSVRVDSLVVEQVLHELLCVGHCEYVFVLKPLSYFLLAFACLYFRVALFKHYD